MTVNLEEGWAPRRLLYESDEPVVELVRRERAPLTKPFFYQDLFVRPPKKVSAGYPRFPQEIREIHQKEI